MRKTTKRSAKAKAWKAFSRWVKVSNADKYGYCECVTCNNRLWFGDPGLHAGHFVPGRTNSILFDEDVVFPQCRLCNFNDGEQARFMIYLMRKGKSVSEIEELLSRRHKIVKYTIQDYLDIADKYNNKTDALMAMKGL